MSRLRAFCVTAAILSLLLSAHRIDAQVLYGSVVGTVVDETGSAVAGAKVRITSTGTQQVRETETDESGTYSFPSLTGDTYDLVVTKSGFQTYTARGMTVAADSRVRMDTTLRVGQVEQSIEVTAAAAALQTDSGEVRTEITTKAIENLPIPIGRNYQNLLVTVPGVSPPTNQHSVAANPSRGLTFNVNGSTRNSNNVRIDGALANNIWLPHVTAYVPALDSIDQVSVVTASADASQGMAGGSAVNVQIKSGTNDIHGSLFEFHASNRLKAKPFFLPVGQGKPKYIDNQFGGSIGGPVVRNSLFYFASYEGSYNRQLGATFATVPTAAIRAGNMSGSANPIYDPLTGNADGTGRTEFPDKIIPANRIDPIAAKIAAAYPLPNVPNLLANNYYATGAYAYDRPKLDVKGTWVATPKLNVAGRLGWLHYNMNNPPVFGESGGGPVSTAGGRAGVASGNVYSSTYSASYVIRPTLVVDSYFGYTQSDSNHDPVRQSEKIGQTLGLPGTNLTDLAGGWPVFQVANYADLGTPGGSSALRYNDRQYEYTANGSWIKSTHTVRFGVDISKYSLNHYEATSAMGVFNFNGNVTTLRNGPSANLYNSFAQLLLGLPSSVSSELHPFDNNRMTSRQKSYSFYAQDTWQASRRLTMSLGIRWDYFPMGTRATRGMERYDFNTNQMLICGVADVPKDCGYNIEQKNFSPRLGLAWRKSESLVFRAGYGLNYDPYPLAFVRNMLTNYPNDLLLTVNGPIAQQPATRLQQGIPAIAIPDISSGRVNVPPAYAVRSLSDYVERGYIQSWNFSVQKQFRGDLVAQAAYVASRQVKISQRFDLNAGQVLGAGSAGQPYFSRFGRTTATELLTPIGHNKYDSLQASLQRRLSRGVAFNIVYTLSKTVGICCDDLSDGPPQIQIPAFFNLNRSLMPFDRTHNFNASFILDSPFGKQNILTRGWQLNGLIAAYSGTPFSVVAANNLNAPGNNQRADLVKSEVKILGGIGPGQSYFDPTAFAAPTTARIGTAGFNILRGPGTFNFDAGVFRNFAVTERWNIQFRGEALNVTNTPHFANPGNNASNSIAAGYSVITATTGTGREGIDERMFRLGLRITF
jgi:hypothetical protein